MSDLQLLALSVIWCIVCIGFLLQQSTRRSRSVGLTGAFLMAFTANYVLGGAIYLFPVATSYPLRVMVLGIQQAAFGIGGFAFGWLLLARRQSRRNKLPAEATTLAGSELEDKHPRIQEIKNRKPAESTFILLIAFVGILCYFLSFYIEMASISRVILILSNLLLAAACLLIYNLVLRKKWYAFLITVLIAAMFPVSGLIFSGFLSFGTMMGVMLIMFYLSMVGLGVRQFGVLLVAGYLGLSILVSYLAARDQIRAAVWGQESYESRATEMSRVFEDLSPFSLSDPTHVGAIDGRLQTDYFIGLAVFNLRRGLASPANGATFLNAFLAVVPRAIWPAKPALAGGSMLMSRYTGMYFSDTTSVGFGPVMEGYVNFGSAGVFFMFMLYGMTIGFLDHQARALLQSGEYGRFVIILLTGFTLVDPFELLATSVAAVASTYLLLSGFRLGIMALRRSRERRTTTWQHAGRIV